MRRLKIQLFSKITNFFYEFVKFSFDIYLNDKSQNALRAFFRSTIVASRNRNINKILRFTIERSFQNKESFSKFEVVFSAQQIETDFSG